MSDISPVEDLIGSLDGSVPSAESFRGTGFTTIRGMPGAAPSMTVSEMLLALLRP